VVLGLLLRLPSFNDSLFGDELATYFVATDRSVGDVVDLLQGNSVTGDLSPPLFFMVASLTDGLGDYAESLRLASLLAGLAAIPLTYVLGDWTVGRAAGLVAAAIVTLSPFLIYYTTEARAYGLTLLLVLLSTLALLRAVETMGAWWWIAYALCSCAAIYAHYTPVYVLAAQFAWTFFARPRARLPLIASNAAVAIAYLPWLPTLRDNTDSPGSKVIGFLTPFNLANVRIELGRFGLGHPYVPLRVLPGWAGIALFLAGIVAGVAGLFVALRGQRLPRPSATLVLVVLLALATPAGLILSSLIGDSVWNSRNLISSWPAMAVAIGALVTAPTRVLRVAAVGLVLAAFALGALKLLDSDHQRPSYAEAARFIERAAAPGDPIVEAPAPTPGPLAPLTDVALANLDESEVERHPAVRLGYPSLRAKLSAPPYAPLPVPSAEQTARRASKLARGRKLFVVIAGPDAVRKIVLDVFSKELPPRYRQVESRTFPGLIPVEVYVFQGARA
jgi:mannosyltransferase